MLLSWGIWKSTRWFYAGVWGEFVLVLLWGPQHHCLGASSSLVFKKKNFWMRCTSNYVMLLVKLRTPICVQRIDFSPLSSLPSSEVVLTQDRSPQVQQSPSVLTCQCGLCRENKDISLKRKNREASAHNKELPIVKEPSSLPGWCFLLEGHSFNKIINFAETFKSMQFKLLNNSLQSPHQMWSGSDLMLSRQRPELSSKGMHLCIQTR